MVGIGKQHGIRIAKDWEFNPVLRDEIAQFLDAHYVEDETTSERLESLKPSFATIDFDFDMQDVAYGAMSTDAMVNAAVEKVSAIDSFVEDEAPAAEDTMFAGLDSLSEKAAQLAEPKITSTGKVSAKAATAGAAAPREIGRSEGLRSWLARLDAPFSTTLMALIDAKGLSDTDVYKRANMSRQLFSRIRSDANYRPAKKTVLALAIAMKLDLQETQDLLERAGFALSHSSKRDVIVEYFITKGNYNLLDVNEALYEFDQPLI